MVELVDNEEQKDFLVPIFSTIVRMYKNIETYKRDTGENPEEDTAGETAGTHVWLREDAIDFNIVTHESFHVCNSLCRRVGIAPEDEEFMAYLLGFVNHEMLEFFIGYEDENDDNEEEVSEDIELEE